MKSTVETIGPANARIMLVGEAPSREDQLLGEPFKGSNGRVLDQLLAAAGIFRESCLITNVARQQPPGNRIAFYFEDRYQTVPKPMLKEWIDKLRFEIETYKPNIVVAIGRTALWALTGETKISECRGYIMESTLVPGQKVLPTYHPRFVIEQWKESFTVVMDLQKAHRSSQTPDMPVDNRNLVGDATLHEWTDYCKYLIDKKAVIAFDIETNPEGCHVNRLGFAHSTNFAMSIGVLNGIYAKFSLEDELTFWNSVQSVLTHCPIVTQNGIFDIGVTHHHLGVLPTSIYFDTHIAAHVVWPETPRSLSYLSSIFLNVPKWKSSAADNPGLYNAADCANTYGVMLGLQNEMNKLQTVETFNFEMSQIYPAIMLQLQGLNIDEDERQKLACLSLEQTDEIKEGLDIIFKREINLNSPKQLAEILYDDLGLPRQYKRRKHASEPRKVTVDANALAALDRSCNHPALSLIMRYKKLHKLVTGFLTVDISPEGKVHTNYNITGATMRREKKGFIVDDEDSYKSFGRWSSSSSIILPYGSGNLQNVPKIARKMYRPPKGNIILQADYKQAEAVVVAYLINDVKLKTMFQQSFNQPVDVCEANYWDVHRITAASMFGIALNEVTSDQRKVGKTIRHATNYSAGPGVVASRLEIPIKEAKVLLDKYHQTTPQLRIWHERIKDELRKTRTLTNLLGRKHRFIDRWDDSLFRSAYSFIPQSTVGDLLNKALVNIYTSHSNWLHLLLQLHDAIYVYIKPHEIESACNALRECMLIPLTTNQGETFTIDIDFSVGDNWGEVEPYTPSQKRQ